MDGLARYIYNGERFRSSDPRLLDVLKASAAVAGELKRAIANDLPSQESVHAVKEEVSRLTRSVAAIPLGRHAQGLNDELNKLRGALATLDQRIGAASGKKAEPEGWPPGLAEHQREIHSQIVSVFLAGDVGSSDPNAASATSGAPR